MLEVNKITNLNERNLNIVVKWLYDWWGKIEGYSYEELICYVLSSLQDNKLPKTYGVFDGDTIIGIYQFTYSDLDSRPDLYPWLANVYVDEKYRKKGIGSLLIQSAIENIGKEGFKELYLYTSYNSFYEKYGFKLTENIDTFKCEPRIQRLYKYEVE